MIDCGIPFADLEDVYEDLKLVLLTHIHHDHFLPSTIKTLAKNRPTLRWGVPKWLEKEVKRLGIDNVDVYESNGVYDYGDYKISPFTLKHNVKNCGYRLFKMIDGNCVYKIIHATDMSSLKGVVAKGYDLYAIEHNYDELLVNAMIFKKLYINDYSYEIKAKKNHCSYQQAQKFYKKNRKIDSKIIKLHISRNYRNNYK